MNGSRAAAGIVMAIAGLTLLSLLPFLPGPYDPLAVPLFLMARVVGTVGLVLVPFGALRLAAERVPRFAHWQFTAAALAAIATLPIWALVLVAAVSQGVLLIGAGLLWGVAIALRRTWRTLVEMRRGAPARRHVMPLYLVAVPLGLWVLQFALLDRAVAMSRTRAIRSASPLIAAIEHHREEQGRYPASLLAAWPDGYSPGLMGIERYDYEPQGESYNLIFEQISNRIGTREFVVYNPRDEQAFAAHVTDILRLTPGQFALLDRAVAMSRTRAIRNAAPLIAAIARHRDEQGRFPESLLAAWPDGYSPGVMGIERYQYEPHGDSYNLMFEQISNRIGTREFVVYNPRDEQAFTAHVSDILRLTPEQLALERTRGHYAVHDAAPHWKYFWFD
jgi:hypothetical protein